MNKKLLQSVREYKKQSIITPLLVTLEVLMEVLIPLEMAKIIDIGIAEGNLGYIIQRGLILVIMAMMSLFFGVQAGNFAAIAGAGYAKNLRHDIYYKVQDFSFKNIDHFSTSGLVTRMTTDITKYPDGLHDEYPPAGKGSDHDYFILGYDPDAQQKSCALIFNRHSGTRWHAVIYRKKSPSTFH